MNLENLGNDQASKLEFHLVEASNLKIDLENYIQVPKPKGSKLNLENFLVS